MPRLQLCSWNIHLGIELEHILTSVRGSKHFRDLDLLLLQEASVRGHQTDAERIAAELGPDYQAFQRNVDRMHGRIRGLAIVWNGATFELLSTDLLSLPHVRSSSVARRHRYWLQPLRLRPRSALVVEGLASGVRVRLYVIHLSPVGFTFQTEQLATILRHAAHREPCDLLVMAGDFNSLRLDRRRWAAWFEARQAEGFINASQDVQWTFRSPSLPLRQKLDNALIRGAEPLVCEAHCPELLGSDHLPLFVSIGL
ncbi:MAG TPA: endonuclease/exonuclease/phosphatase family protein [Chloroflexota bacterium]|jgi:endonuclease/exonuclease/phosphatase family metal-dependent hydrolase